MSGSFVLGQISGFHTEENMKMLMEEGIDGYVADRLMRKRDPRFAEVDRYKEQSRKERAKWEGKRQHFRPREFAYNKDSGTCICPAGKPL